MSRPWLPPASLNGANVGKRTEILSGAPSPEAEGSRGVAGPPRALRPPGSQQAAIGARRRIRRAPGVRPVPLLRPAAPLPDPAMVGLFAVPDPAPPYDDESPVSAAGHGPGHVDPDLAVPAPARAAGPGGAEPAGPEPRCMDGTDAETMGGGAESADPGPDSGKPAAGGRVADATPAAKRAQGGKHAQAAWPNLFAQVLAETLAGSRPARQLSAWTTQQARSRIRRLGPLLRVDREPHAAGSGSFATGGKRPMGGCEPRVRRVVASMPSADVVEMAVVVRFGPRVRALAVRLERPEGRDWICTAIEAA
jgi:hypothetical protein